METRANNTTNIVNELSPELSAWEAALAMSKPTVLQAVTEQTKAHALLETCQAYSPDKINLVELVLNTDEQRISRSLRQYVKTERFRSVAFGIVIGLFAGAVLNVFGMVLLLLLLK
jgi:ElaB/YqjD/DUF883 family membrane-anchored ribosome-binding protein